MPSPFIQVVLDASVLVQTVVKEEYSDAALKLLGTVKKIYVPSLLIRQYFGGIES